MTCCFRKWLKRGQSDKSAALNVVFLCHARSFTEEMSSVMKKIVWKFILIPLLQWFKAAEAKKKIKECLALLLLLGSVLRRRNYWSSWYKESVGVGMCIGFTLILLLGRYFHGLTERTSVSQHTHTHTHSTPSQKSTGSLHQERKKNPHPILIKWISLSAFLPSYLSAASV